MRARSAAVHSIGCGSASGLEIRRSQAQAKRCARRMQTPATRPGVIVESRQADRPPIPRTD
jgi:hypothetical protein